jgi:hypothetical protein
MIKARLLLGFGTYPRDPDSCWRIQLDSVDAWSFGALAGVEATSSASPEPS